MGDKDSSTQGQLDPKETGRGGRIIIDTDTGHVRSIEEMNERAARYEQDNQDQKES